MNIEFLTLKLENFMSFSNAEIKLDNQSFTLVSGVNNNPDDLASSNGSGKSSLWEGIIWCLTGETIRGTKKVVNKYTEGGASVELTFILDQNNYKIIRYKDHKEFGTNLKVYINNEDKSGKGIRDTENLLAQYLPDLTPSLLNSVIILGQGLPQRFSNNTPSGRKEVLEKLSKSDFMITDIKNKLTERKIKLNTENRKVEDEILSESSKKSIYENQLIILKNNKLNLVPIDNFDNEISQLETIIQTLTEEKLKKIVDKDSVQLKVNAKLEEYQDWITKSNNEMIRIKNESMDSLELEQLDKDILNLKIQVQSRKNKIKELESITDICPTCGQKLPNVTKVDTSYLYQEVDEITNQLSTLVNNKDSLNKLLKEKLNNTQATLNSQTQQLKNEGTALREELNNLLLELNNLDKQINDNKLALNKLISDKENNQKQYETIDNDIQVCETNIKTLSEKLLYNNIEKDNLQNHLDIVTKMLTIATRDFRGYLLSEVISYINLKSKEYCKDILETDKIDFSLDGNNINISYCDKEYENLSGGEKQKIDIIIQFAIRDMLSQFLSFSSNILVLDEIFDNLDNLGCQKVLNLISNKLTDIESIFIITHHTDIDIPADNCITIYKDSNGISRV